MAASRARETSRTDRLFDDALAEVLAGPEGREILQRMEAGIPGTPTVPIRTRFFDDQLTALAAGPDLAQVVLVAAGMDTRAFLLGLPSRLTLFEVTAPNCSPSNNAAWPGPAPSRHAAGSPSPPTWPATGTST
jgi:methyltransferase (TIGR00027 family)